jgi:hypothetical protein
VSAGVVLNPHPTRGEVYVPPGFEVLQITDGPHLMYSGPKINNCGQFVFAKSLDGSNEGLEIFLYDDGELIQITDDDCADRDPDINDNGRIIWQKELVPGDYFSCEIAMYEDGETTILTDGAFPKALPRINNLGHAVWYKSLGGSGDPANIIFYDGLHMNRLTDDGYRNVYPVINDYDEIAWVRLTLGSWASTVVLWINGETTELWTDDEGARTFDINNNTQIVWSASAGIFLWEGGEVELFMSSGGSAYLNNDGDMAFSGWNDGVDAWEQWLWLDGDFVQLTAGLPPNNGGTINDFREVPWLRHEEDFLLSNVMLLRPIAGNVNGDDVIDHLDCQALAGCLAGPGGSSRSCATGTGDYDFDGDVDLHDFVLLQLRDPDLAAFVELMSCFTGPMLGAFPDSCLCRLIDLDADGDTDLADYAIFQRLVDVPE